MTTSSCSNHKIIDLKNLRKASKINSRMTILDFRRADCNFFRELIDRIPLEATLKGKGAQKAGCSSRITLSKQTNGPLQ